MFGIDKLKLPEILPSNAIIGKLLPDIAAQIGCQPAIPVICGAGDMSVSYTHLDVYKRQQH